MTREANNGLSRKERLRRVVLLCASFCRNLAYQRAMVPFKDRLKAADHEFWMTMSNNSLDISILEWCKLFADKKDPHHWSKVVTSPAEFEEELLGALGLSTDQFAEYQTSVRAYRDKFVAHLDSEPIMDIPSLDAAELAVAFYHGHVAEKEAEAGMLDNLPSSRAAMATYYNAEERSARLRYDRAMDPKPA